MILPPGAFLTLGVLMALMNLINRRLEVKRSVENKESK
jgi:Na+-translocating ferredoxin:NAD+ oxidoreductase RnfE subunit